MQVLSDVRVPQIYEVTVSWGADLNRIVEIEGDCVGVELITIRSNTIVLNGRRIFSVYLTPKKPASIRTRKINFERNLHKLIF